MYALCICIIQPQEIIEDADSSYCLKQSISLYAKRVRNMLESSSDSVTTTTSIDRRDKNSSILQFNDDHDDNFIDYSINIGFELKTVLNMDTHRLTMIERFVDYNFEAYAHTHIQYYRRAYHTNIRMAVNFAQIKMNYILYEF